MATFHKAIKNVLIIRDFFSDWCDSAHNPFAFGEPFLQFYGYETMITSDKCDII